MSPNMPDGNFRMHFDDVAWEQSERIHEEWKKIYIQEDFQRAIGSLILKHRGGVPVELCAPVTGAFNVCSRMIFMDGGSAMIRFSWPGDSICREEKVRNEVVILRYLAEHTSIPVPFVLYHGTVDESPENFGPFIIMEYIEHEFTMGHVLNLHSSDRDARPVLDPDVPKERLEYLYGQVASVLLQLTACSFPQIGSLTEVESGEWNVTRRPFTFQMNELGVVGDFPQDKLPTETPNCAPKYFESIAQLHRRHLKYQRNDAVISEGDCRKRYVARQLVSKAVEERRLASRDLENGPFRLFCDDLRPFNILLNADYRIVGIVDWEFTYAAPAEFAFSPPWWLILEKPHYWKAGLDDWSKSYEKSLSIFLRALENEEREAEEQGKHKLSGLHLSSRMRESWQNGDFWKFYALRHSFAVDMLFWQRLRHLLYPEVDENEIETLLSDAERAEIEPFVAMKLKQRETRELNGWDNGTVPSGE